MAKVDVVIVGGSANALGILRSLAGNAHCLVLADDKNLPVFASRFGEKILVESTKSAVIIDELVRLAKSFQHAPVLLLSEEKTVEQVSQHRARLETSYRFDLVAHELILALQSKSAFQQLAEQQQAPIPKAVVINQAADFSKITELTFPCVFKPLRQSAAYSRQFKKAYKVESKAQVIELYQQISPVMPEMLVQEWIHGQDSDIYFCFAYFDQDQTMIGSFSGRKLRSWPLNIGGTASCTNAPEAHDELSHLTQKFAQAVNFKGLLGMEYKFDQQRKQFYMIEPTVARTDYQHEIATLSGHNLLRQIYCSLSGQAIPQYTLSRSAIVWRDEIADANALAHGGNKTEPNGAKRYSTLLRYNDVGPYLTHMSKRIRLRFTGFFNE